MKCGTKVTVHAAIAGQKRTGQGVGGRKKIDADGKTVVGRTRFSDDQEFPSSSSRPEDSERGYGSSATSG